MAVLTGLQKLDGLCGGIPGGVITDICGGTGTGKTQLLMQLAASSARGGGRVLYVDTTGRFRPERIVEIQGAAGAGPDLDRITVYRARNTSEQVRSAESMAGFSMIAVDSITDLFTYEYVGIESALERNSLFMRHMRDLADIAVSENIPVIITNTVRTIGNVEVESMRSAVDPFTHIRIRLSRDGKRFRGSAAWALGGAEFAYEIGAAGLCEPQDI